MNNVCLLGRLTHDIELRYTPNGISVTNFTLAVDRPYSSKGEDRQSYFINCVSWRQTAEFLSKYFSKGKRVCLVGFLQSRRFTDKDGNSRSSMEVVVEHVYFADGKIQPAVASAAEFEEVASDEDIPF